MSQVCVVKSYFCVFPSAPIRHFHTVWCYSNFPTRTLKPHMPFSFSFYIWPHPNWLLAVCLISGSSSCPHSLSLFSVTKRTLWLLENMVMTFRPPSDKPPFKMIDVNTLFKLQSPIFGFPIPGLPWWEENMSPLNLIRQQVKKGRPWSNCLRWW